jgi:hypothetical protein
MDGCTSSYKSRLHYLFTLWLQGYDVVGCDSMAKSHVFLDVDFIVACSGAFGCALMDSNVDILSC